MPEVNTNMMNFYLKELEKAFPGYNIIVIMDQAAWHKSDDLIAIDNIRLLFLPPYSPELNPIERLWRWLRKERIHNRIYKSLDAMMDALEFEFKNLSNERFKTLCACSYL